MKKSLLFVIAFTLVSLFASSSVFAATVCEDEFTIFHGKTLTGKKAIWLCEVEGNMNYQYGPVDGTKAEMTFSLPLDTVVFSKDYSGKDITLLAQFKNNGLDYNVGIYQGDYAIWIQQGAKLIAKIQVDPASVTQNIARY